MLKGRRLVSWRSYSVSRAPASLRRYDRPEGPGACVAAPAFAEQQEATIVLGAGQKTCGEYLAVVYGLSPGSFRVATTPTGKTYGNDARALYEWLAGFISAANATSPDGVQIKTNPAAIDVWMRKHCEQNRTGSISHAAQQFVQELRVK